MTGDQWAKKHGKAWQQFLGKMLQPCACTNPRVSNSHRAKALKEDDGDGVLPGEPAACLVCFAPIAQEVRAPAPRPGPLAHAARLLAARCLPRRGCIPRTPPRRRSYPARPARSHPRTNGHAVRSRACEFPLTSLPVLSPTLRLRPCTQIEGHLPILNAFLRSNPQAESDYKKLDHFANKSLPKDHLYALGLESGCSCPKPKPFLLRLPHTHPDVTTHA